MDAGLAATGVVGAAPAGGRGLSLGRTAAGAPGGRVEGGIGGRGPCGGIGRAATPSGGCPAGGRTGSLGCGRLEITRCSTEPSSRGAAATGATGSGAGGRTAGTGAAAGTTGASVGAGVGVGAGATGGALAPTTDGPGAGRSTTDSTGLGASAGLIASTTGAGAGAAGAGTSTSAPFLPLGSTLGSSGCSSRVRPSLVARRRRRSPCASWMLEEWLLASMPRTIARSSVSLFVIPSSLASSCSRMFFGTETINLSSGCRATTPEQARALARRVILSRSERRLRMRVADSLQLAVAEGAARPGRMPDGAEPAPGIRSRNDKSTRPDHSMSHRQ